jgi:hypothetical protein
VPFLGAQAPTRLRLERNPQSLPPQRPFDVIHPGALTGKRKRKGLVEKLHRRILRRVEPRVHPFPGNLVEVNLKLR